MKVDFTGDSTSLYLPLKKTSKKCTSFRKPLSLPTCIHTLQLPPSSLYVAWMCDRKKHHQPVSLSFHHFCKETTSQWCFIYDFLATIALWSYGKMRGQWKGNSLLHDDFSLQTHCTHLFLLQWCVFSSYFTLSHLSYSSHSLASHSPNISKITHGMRFNTWGAIWSTREMTVKWGCSQWHCVNITKLSPLLICVKDLNYQPENMTQKEEGESIEKWFSRVGKRQTFETQKGVKWRQQRDGFPDSPQNSWTLFSGSCCCVVNPGGMQLWG